MAMSKKIPIIAISGTSCSGKGTVVDYYKTEFDCHHRSIRAMIAEAGHTLLKIPKEEIVTRDHFREIARELRTKHGASCLIDFILETAPRDGKPIIIESVRALGEMHALNSHPDFEIISIFIDAPQKHRYTWSLERKDDSDTDKSGLISYEEFLRREELEWNPADPNDHTKQNILGVSKICQHKIMNDKTRDHLIESVKHIAHRTFAKHKARQK